MKGFRAARSCFACVVIATCLVLATLRLGGPGFQHRRYHRGSSRFRGERRFDLERDWTRSESGAGPAGTGGSGTRFEVDDLDLRRALQHAGTGERVRRFLRKAALRQGFTMSVIGGSVSKGRGLQAVNGTTKDTVGAMTLYSPENMHVRIYEWLDGVFPSRNNRLVNGAQGGAGAGYFAWCYEEHIPADSDLIIVELGINDVFAPELVPEYEQLLRTLLTLPNQPAIINIEVFSLLFDTVMTSSSLHADVLSFYDVPSLSIRDLLMPSLIARPDAEIPRWFRTDPKLTLHDAKVQEWGGKLVDLLHMSALGHDLTAQVVIRYFEDVVQETFRPWWARRRDDDAYVDIEVPSNLLTSIFDPAHPPLLSRPTCRSVNAGLLGSAIDVAGAGRLAPFEASRGWSEWQWKEKKYLTSNHPGSAVLFHLVIPPEDDRGLPEEDTNRWHRLQKLHEQVLHDYAGEANTGDEMHLNEDEDDGDEDYVKGDRGEQMQSLHPIQSTGTGYREKRRLPKKRKLRLGPSHTHSVAVAYQKSRSFGLGKVKCWVDHRESEAVELDGYWDEPIRNSVVADVVMTGLTSGAHTLHCLHLEPPTPQEKSEFRIVAVMYD